MALNIQHAEYHTSFLSISAPQTNELNVLADAEVFFEGHGHLKIREKAQAQMP